MAGFPFFQLDRYLKILVQEMGRHVAISEEFSRDSSSGGPVDLSNKNLFERRVSRVITPGTLIDEKFMETGRNNFLLAVQRLHGQVGLAWMDLSTGDFYTQESSADTLLSDIRRIQPSEILSLDETPFEAEFTVTKVEQTTAVSKEWQDLVAQSREDFEEAEALAGTCLLQYISINLPDSDVTMMAPIKRKASESMLLDSNALFSLEIRRSMRGEVFRGSLLHALRRTTTKSGTRLLGEWLVSPCTSIPVIEERLDLVTLFIHEPALKLDVTRFLKSSGDAARVLQRFGFGRGEVDDLLTITRAITATEELMSILATHDRSQSITRRMTVLTSLRKRILASIDEAGLLQRNREDADNASRVMQEVMQAMGSLDAAVPVERRRKAIERDMVYTMKPSASAALRQMHKNLAAMMIERAELQEKLRRDTAMSSLTLKTLPGLSHIAHVKNGDAKVLVDPLVARAVAATRSTKSYHFTEWSYLGTRIEGERVRISQEESSTFRKLRKEVLLNSKELRQNARVLDEIDIACCLASIASENDWTRPTFHTTNDTTIIDGRHPIVEFALRAKGQHFTPNSTYFHLFAKHHHMMYLITGPNMGGKSTYLRQTAIIQILAQIGSYTPCTSASLPIVDAIYSRMGSSDSLYTNESTFYIEMKETAGILRHATKRSLVLMDEVGRGTTGVDGTSIAYATLLALHDIGAKVLFATHFHELADLVDESTLPNESSLKVRQDGEGRVEDGAEVETRHGALRVGCLCTGIDLIDPDPDPDPESDPDSDSAPPAPSSEDSTGAGAGTGIGAGTGDATDTYTTPGFTFTHRLTPGVARDSHGLKVAVLAGVPDHIVRVAHHTRRRLLRSRCSV